jgi:hypothetical protein
MTVYVTTPAVFGLSKMLCDVVRAALRPNAAAPLPSSVAERWKRREKSASLVALTASTEDITKTLSAPFGMANMTVIKLLVEGGPIMLMELP